MKTLSLTQIHEDLKQGQALWADFTLSCRIRCITQFSEELERQKESLAELLTQEMGKPIEQSRSEIDGARGRIQYFLENCEEVLSAGRQNQDGNTEEMIEYEPLGVIGNISAWNYPYLVAVNVIIPALLAGNAVMYKPSEHTPKTGLRIQELLYAGGVLENVFVTVTGDGSVGESMLELPLDGYFFTGSSRTGRYIAEKVAHKLVPVGLELGGKDPLYVTDDVADLQQVAESTVEGAFYNNGQSCCAVERIYVHQNVYDQFIEYFTAAVKQLSPGKLTLPSHPDFLKNQIADAVEKGANLVVGGESDGQIFAPTVLTNVSHKMLVMKEETFGPLIGIQKVEDDHEAIELMDETEYGLTASVYSQDIDRAKWILHHLDVGTAYVNCCDRVSPHLPWTGRRMSGIGSTLSYLGILAFVQPKAYHIRRN